MIYKKIKQINANFGIKVGQRKERFNGTRISLEKPIGPFYKVILEPFFLQKQ